ncbi:MAG: PH domain-containing protein [Steroidobacteraceae bacterium]
MNDAVNGTEPGLTKPLEYLRSVLIPSETLQAWAIQRRIFAVARRRQLIAATSGRLILLNRKLLGGFDVSDIRWQDLEEVTLRVGMLGADLLIRAGRATDLASQGNQGSQRLEFPGLRKEQAQAVYRICQAQDQAWREKRRVRELEELRARSGGIQVTSGAGGYGAPAYGPPGADGQPDAVRRLQEAKQMLDGKLITDAEYEAIKAKIVSS